MPAPYSLMLARFPGGGKEDPSSSGYLMQLQEILLNDHRVGDIFPFRISDTPITMCRNLAVKASLENKVDYILMIDADMDPDCEEGAPTFWSTAWEFLMERRKSEDESWEFYSDGKGRPAPELVPPCTIAAPYCGPPPVECVYVFKWATLTSDDPQTKFKLEMIGREEAIPKRGIEEVAAIGTGLILYDARVFQKLPPPWFEYEWTDEYRVRKASTEDVYQTRNQSLMGMPVFCAWDCWAGHNKVKRVGKPKGMAMKALRKEFADALLRGQGKADEIVQERSQTPLDAHPESVPTLRF